MPITKSMVQKAKRERAVDAQGAAQKPKPSRKRQRETDNAAEREEKGSFQTSIRETRSQARKRQAQESEVGSSRQATPKRRQPGQRSKASRRRNAPPSSGPISRSKGSLSDGTIADLLIQGIQDFEQKEKEYSTYKPPVTRSTTRSTSVALSEARPSRQANLSKRQPTTRTAEPEPRQPAPSTSLQAARSTTHNHGESIRTVSTGKPAPSDKGKNSISRGDQKRKDKGNPSVYPAHHDESQSQVLAGQTISAMTSKQPVQDRFNISAATSQIASLFPQFYGQGVRAASSYEPSVTRPSTLISTECGTETSNATTSAVAEGNQYVPDSESESTDPTLIQPSAVSDATDIQPGAASETTVTAAAHCRRRKTTWKDRARLRKEAQKKANNELKANTGYGVGTKTTAFLHWIPVPSDRKYLQKIESALWRRNSMKGERGKGRGYRDAWWWHFANHYKIQAENVSCELDYSELIRASAEASVFSNKPGLMDMGVPTCDRCFFMGRACRTDQINACVNCVKAFQPCTMTERKHPFTRRQFTGQRWINHGYDINFNIIKKRTDDPHKLFCNWEDVPLPPPPRTGELVYLRGRSLERPDPDQPKALPCLPFDRAYQVPDRIYEKYNLHEIDWPWPLPDPFPEGDEEPTGETPEERQRRLATKAEVEEKRVRYNMRQQERRQQTGNEELPGTREKRVYSIEWQKARQKQMMADYHQRTRHMKTLKRSTRGRSRTQSRATATMAEERPDEQLEQQVEEQLQNDLEQQTEHRPQNAQLQTDQQLQDTLQQHIQHQQPPQSQTEVAIQHENDIEMADTISQVQAVTDQETGDSIMAQANNAISSHSGIPIDPILERMQFYNSLHPGQFQTNTRFRSSFQATTYERVQALGNTESHAPAQDGRETREQTKMFGCRRQERRAATNENEATNERTLQAIQLDPNTVARTGYQVLQRATAAASNNPPAASTPRIPSFTAQASCDNSYPDPPVKDTDAFGYYAIARVEAAPENLFGYPVIPVPSNFIHRPSEEAQNEWHISGPKTDTESPVPAPVYPTFTTRNAQRYSKEQTDGSSDDVEMSGF